MITTNIYKNNVDYVWYDSSNIVFSKYYDSKKGSNTLKIVFKNGRTYVYKDVTVQDYVCFKTTQSAGNGFNTYIKKYEGNRISDTDLDKLEEYKKTLVEGKEELSEAKVGGLDYHIDYVMETQQFQLKLHDTPIYTGISDSVDIFSLFNAMGINYTYGAVEKIENQTDEDKDEIEL